MFVNRKLFHMRRPWCSSQLRGVVPSTLTQENVNCGKYWHAPQFPDSWEQHGCFKGPWQVKNAFGCSEWNHIRSSTHPGLSNSSGELNRYIYHCSCIHISCVYIYIYIYIQQFALHVYSVYKYHRAVRCIYINMKAATKNQQTSEGGPSKRWRSCNTFSSLENLSTRSIQKWTQTSLHFNKNSWSNISRSLFHKKSHHNSRSLSLQEPRYFFRSSSNCRSVGQTLSWSHGHIHLHLISKIRFKKHVALGR